MEVQEQREILLRLGYGHNPYSLHGEQGQRLRTIIRESLSKMAHVLGPTEWSIDDLQCNLIKPNNQVRTLVNSQQRLKI